MDGGARLAAGLGQHLARGSAQNGCAKPTWATSPRPKKVEARCEGAVHELVGDHHVQGRVLLLERADRGDGEDPLHAQRLQGEDVGAEVELAGQRCGGRGRGGAGRRPSGPRACPSTKASEGGPKGVSTATSRTSVEALHLVEAAAADDPDGRPARCSTSPTSLRGFDAARSGTGHGSRRPLAPPRGQALSWPAMKITPGSLTLATVALLAYRTAAIPTRRGNLGRFFPGYASTLVVLDLDSGAITRHNPELARRRFSPCSTFKIPNSLIGLETGVIPGPDFVLPWDGTHYEIAAWNRDHDLRSAIANSVVWYYRELARRVGLARMKEYVERFSYGNQDLSGGVDRFWLGSSLRISPEEQVAFLRRFETGDAWGFFPQPRHRQGDRDPTLGRGRGLPGKDRELQQRRRRSRPRVVGGHRRRTRGHRYAFAGPPRGQGGVGARGAPHGRGRPRRARGASRAASRPRPDRRLYSARNDAMGSVRAARRAGK